IAVLQHGLSRFLWYVDDHFDFNWKDDVAWYGQYRKLMPDGQVMLLELWDELGIPHSERKQVSGPTLHIIGFDVDPNQMTICMSLEKWVKLITTCRTFTEPGAHFPLHDFWAL